MDIATKSQSKESDTVLHWIHQLDVLSRVWFFAIPWTIAHQASLSVGFPRQEYWSGLPFPSPRDLPDPGIKPVCPGMQVDSLPPSHWGSQLVCQWFDSLPVPAVMACFTKCDQSCYEKGKLKRIVWDPVRANFYSLYICCCFPIVWDSILESIKWLLFLFYNFTSQVIWNNFSTIAQ